VTSAYGSRLPSDRRVSRTSRTLLGCTHPAADPPVLTATPTDCYVGACLVVGERGSGLDSRLPWEGTRWFVGNVGILPDLPARRCIYERCWPGQRF